MWFSGNRELVWSDRIALNSAPTFLAGLTSLPPQETHLDCLGLRAVALNGDLLACMLESHRHSLRRVSFQHVSLTNGNAWPRILTALHTTGMQHLSLGFLHFREDEGNEEDLELPVQALENFILETEAEHGIRVSTRSIRAWPSSVTRALEVVLMILPGGKALISY